MVITIASGAASDFLADALLPGGADLEVGDARNVVIGHRGRDIFGRGDGEGEALVRAAMRPVALGERGEPVEIFEPVSWIEIVDQFARAGRDHRLRFGGETRGCARRSGRDRRRRFFSGQFVKRFSGKRWIGSMRIGVRLLEGGVEGARLDLDARSAGADRFLKGRARKRQRSGRRERAEHRRRK